VETAALFKSSDPGLADAVFGGDDTGSEPAVAVVKDTLAEVE
jgi:hypothetical protein